MRLIKTRQRRSDVHKLLKGFAAGLMLSISFFDLAHNAINSIGFLKGNLWVSILFQYYEESKLSEIIHFWYYCFSYSSIYCVDSSLEVLSLYLCFQCYNKPMPNIISTDTDPINTITVILYFYFKTP